MMGVDCLRTFVRCSELTRLVAREDFTASSYRESFTYGAFVQFNHGVFWRLYIPKKYEALPRPDTSFDVNALLDPSYLEDLS